MTVNRLETRLSAPTMGPFGLHLQYRDGFLLDVALALVSSMGYQPGLTML